MSGIYLDYNATTPIDPQVADAMLPFVHGLFGNPSSGHSFGVAAREGVDTARAQVAGMLGCSVDDLIFTSGGTEANNHAIRGVVSAYRERGDHIITTAVEHPAVTEVCRYLEKYNIRTTYLPVDEHGMVDPQQVEEAITPETLLVTIMHANNEVGTIMPIAEIAEIAHRHGVPVHSDCAQSIGKIPVKVDDLGVDLLSVAGHKLYAPKGIGALYVRPGVELAKLMHGASHEQNRRAGTENVIEMAGLGKACELIEQNLAEYADHMRATRDRLESGLLESGHDARINGHPGRAVAQHVQHRVSRRGGRPGPGEPAHRGGVGGGSLPQRRGGSVPRFAGHERAHRVRHGDVAAHRGPLHHRGRDRPGGGGDRGGGGEHVAGRSRLLTAPTIVEWARLPGPTRLPSA